MRKIALVLWWSLLLQGCAWTGQQVRSGMEWGNRLNDNILDTIAH